MEFGVPPRNEEVASFSLRMQQPSQLRAEKGIDYLGFIKLVTDLWKEVHPDIPIRPTQSPKYAKYPVIVYGLEMRKTHVTEPKKRFRETEYRRDDDTHLMIHAQRFDNVITFTVITENNPKYCETIIETFEDFMMEHTPVFKQMGVSEFTYVRRKPDHEVTKPDEDNDERAVSYLVVLEKVIVTEVGKLEHILVKARTDMRHYYSGSEFWWADPTDGSDENDIPEYLVCPNNPFELGDLVQIHRPNHNQDSSNNNMFDFVVPNHLPYGLFESAVYQVVNMDGPKIYLKNLDGRDIIVTSTGMGVITGAPDLSAFVDTEVVDDFGEPPSD